MGNSKMPASFYNKNAQQLADMYLSKSFEEVHQAWLDYLPAVLNKTDATDKSSDVPCSLQSLGGLNWLTKKISHQLIKHQMKQKY